MPSRRLRHVAVDFSSPLLILVALPDALYGAAYFVEAVAREAFAPES